jgi:hypothetical protein
MSDTGKYSNHIQTVNLDGTDYQLKGLGIAEILSEGAQHVKQAHIAEAKETADEMGLESNDRVSFTLQWLKDNPYPEGAELEEMALDYIASPGGVLQITAFALARQADIELGEATDIITRSDYINLLEAAQVFFGGLIDLMGASKPSKKPVRKREKR